jgi:hypothetical protein
MAEDNKTRLKRLTLMAVDRYRNNEPFTNEEVTAYFECIGTVFGENEASGFLNRVLDTIKKHGYENLNNNFGMAVTVAIGEQAQMREPRESEKTKSK